MQEYLYKVLELDTVEESDELPVFSRGINAINTVFHIASFVEAGKMTNHLYASILTLYGVDLVEYSALIV